jgi:putative redox protein
MHVDMNFKSGSEFEATIGRHKISFDTVAPFGRDQAPSPKAVMLASILGCSGIDIAGFLKKFKMTPTKFSMSADATARDEHPKIFPRIDVEFIFEGQDLDVSKLIESVQLSMTKYCGVSAMIAPTSPIFYRILVNQEEVSQGEARF